MNHPAGEGIPEFLMRYVSEARHRVSAGELAAAGAQRFGWTRKALRQQIRTLVTAGRLEYVYEFGASYLQTALRFPVRLSRRIVLMPWDERITNTDGGIAIRILPGAAFGTGQHPTTRLALRAMEATVEAITGGGRRAETALLDVGTGSGILAIAALKLGIDRGLGLDVDPCAVADARRNAALNGLQGVLDISHRRLEDLPECGDFDLIAANLRTPTLIGCAAEIARRLRGGGAVVLSGIRTEEAHEVAAAYEAQGLRLCRQLAEKGWVAMRMAHGRRGGQDA